MLNNIVIVGKISELPQIRETVMGNKVCSLQVEVQRSFPNSDGVYESDIVPITLWKGMAEEALEYANIGSIIGIKGRLQSHEAKSKAGNEFRALNVVAEHITYLS